jgi:integrase
MARRPESKARGDIHDARAFEESRCPSRDQIAKLVNYLHTIIRSAPRERELLAEDGVWLKVRDAFAVLALLLTGLRRFEFCGLTTGAFDASAAKLHVVGKGRVRDYVPLPDGAVRVLSDWLALKALRGESTQADAPMFCATGVGDGAFMSFGALRLRWRRVLGAAGLPTGFGIHAARHAAGLIVYAATGGDLGKTARFLRHRDTAVTSRFYMHIDADALRRELATVDVWRAP